MLVIVSLLLTISPWRYLHSHALRLGLINQGLAVVAFVSDQMLCWHAINQALSLATVRSGTLCNNDSERHTMRIHGQMYLGVEPPFVRPMPSLPPLAPVAC